MILLDANALIFLLLDQPAAPEVAELLRSRECGMPTPCVAEVKDMLIRRHGISEERFVERVAPLQEVAIQALVVDVPIAQRAGEIRAAHYSRADAPLSLADSILLACAEEEDGEIATADRVVVDVAGKLGLAVLPLLDSRGRR